MADSQEFKEVRGRGKSNKTWCLLENSSKTVPLAFREERVDTTQIVENFDKKDGRTATMRRKDF